MAFIYDLIDTWNSSGTTFTAIKMNVTDTESAAGSLLLDLKVGGESQLSVSKTGLTTVAGSLNNPALRIGTVNNHTGIVIYNFAAEKVIFGPYHTTFNSLYALQWNSSTTAIQSDADTFISRRGAANLRFGGGAVGAADTSASATITVTIATPGVVTWSNHRLTTGTPVIFTTTGAMPTGITANTTYYAIAVDTNTFQFATSFANALAGTAVNTSGSQSGTHTGRRGAIAQTIGVQDTLSTSSLENIDGADFVIRGSRGIGNKPGGSIIFQVAPAGSSGTAQNALSAALTINADRTVTADGAISATGSTASNVAFARNGTPGTGMYFPSSSNVTFAVNGTGAFNLSTVSASWPSNYSLGWLSGAIGTSLDLILTRRGTANLRFGAADAAAPVAQTLSVQSVVAGTTDTAGADLTITGSQGTGSGAAGKIVFQTAAAGSSGPDQNALATVATIGPSTLTGSQAISLLDLAQTWNTSGTPTGIKLNVTDTASAAASLLLDLQVGGASKFNVRKNGVVNVEEFIISRRGMYSSGAAVAVGYGVGEIAARFSGRIGFTSTNDATIPLDTILTRRGTANLRFGAGDAAAPVPQILSVQSVVAGTTNTPGADLTITGSQGTGSGAAGTIAFQTASAGSSGPDQNALATVVTIGPSTLSGSQAISLLDLAQTWNTSGTPTGIKLNVTDTASASGSLLLDLQVGGTSQFSVSKGGVVRGVFRSPATGTASAGISSNLLSLGSSGSLSFGSTGDATGSFDTFITRRAAANLRFGAADAAAPVAQKLSVQSVVAGTTNTAGADLTITGSQGTGSGAGGSIIFQVAPAGSSGTDQNALSTALTIGSDRSLLISKFGSGTDPSIVAYDTGGIRSGFAFPNSGTDVVFTRANASMWGVGFNRCSVTSGARFSWSGSADPLGTEDVILTRRGAANLRFGAADAATALAQTLSVQSVVAGTTNTPGANLTITGSQGTGTGAGGSIIFQVAPAGSSSTVQNALSTVLTIRADGSIETPRLGFYSSATGSGTLVPLVGVDSSNSLVFGNPSGNTNTRIKFPSAGDISLQGSSKNVIFNTGVTQAELARFTSDGAWQPTNNIFDIRNSTNAQAFRLYNTYTDASNYERGVANWTTFTNVFTIGTEKSGTGVARSLYFMTDGSARWNVQTTGHLVAVTDNVYDIGALGSARPRIGYFGTGILSPYIQFNSEGRIAPFGDGIVRFTNAALNDFNRIIFGAATSAFPALKRSSTTLQARLADDSGFANLAAAQVTIPLQTLTDGANVAWNCNNGAKAKVTLGDNRTIDAVTNAVEGTSYTLWVIQDATGSRTVTWTTSGAGSFDFGTEGTPVLTTTASAADALGFEAISIGGTLKLRFMGIKRGFA